MKMRNTTDLAKITRFNFWPIEYTANTSLANVLKYTLEESIILICKCFRFTKYNVPKYSFYEVEKNEAKNNAEIEIDDRLKYCGIDLSSREDACK